jgi:hypothetical protein
MANGRTNDQGGLCLYPAATNVTYAALGGHDKENAERSGVSRN